MYYDNVKLETHHTVNDLRTSTGTYTSTLSNTALIDYYFVI